MFGISPIGWVHTLGSLPAIPVAMYMLGRHGRIVPRSKLGAVYFGSMIIGAATVFLVAKTPVSPIIGAVTLAVVLLGYGARRLLNDSRASRYVETICLTLSVFLLMVPTVSEILRRVPDGHPIVTDLHAPLLVGCHIALLLMLIVGLTLQIIQLRRSKQ